MRTRVIVGVALLVMLLALLYFGGYVYLGVLTLFSLAAVYEMQLAFRKKGYAPLMAPVYAFAALYPWIYYFAGTELLVGVYLLALLVTASLIVFRKNGAITDAIVTLFLFVYPLTFAMATLLVYFAFDRPTGLVAACMALFAPEVCDMFAYFAGTLFGKRKLCPSISPKKTVEGSIGALVGGLVFSVILILVEPLWGGSVPAVALLALGLVCGVFSQLGDLFASMIKRWAEIKDFSSVFPGHGGILDRIDSILFCAPAVLVTFMALTKLG